MVWQRVLIRRGASCGQARIALCQPAAHIVTAMEMVIASIRDESCGLSGSQDSISCETSVMPLARVRIRG
jgi:hypothetical protein